MLRLARRKTRLRKERRVEANNQCEVRRRRSAGCSQRHVPSVQTFFRTVLPFEHIDARLSLSLSRLPPLILSQLRGAGGFSLSVSLSLSLCLSVSLSLPLSRLSLSLSLAPTLTCNNATSMWELWVVLRAAALKTLRCERHISPSHHDALEGSCEAGGVAWVSSRPRQVNLEWVARRHPLRDRLMKVSQPR